MTTRILGTGSYLPANVVTNDDLAKIMDTSDEWIRTRTGICSRHISEDENTSDMAVKAAKEALLDAGVDASEIELIIVATFTGEKLMPNIASIVQAQIGAQNAVCFDLSAACSGFLFALNVAHGFIKFGTYKKALIIGAENLSKTVDWDDRSTAVLFGDGAGAAVVGADSEGMVDFVMGSDGIRGEVLYMNGKQLANPYVKLEETEVNPWMYMNGQEVFKFAVRKVPECVEELLEKANIDKSDIDYFILHQANVRIIESVSKRLGVDIDKFPTNLARCGNTSAASIPILLDELNKNGTLKKGDRLILSGFGGGLSWGAAYLTW